MTWAGTPYVWLLSYSLRSHIPNQIPGFSCDAGWWIKLQASHFTTPHCSYWSSGPNSLPSGRTGEHSFWCGCLGWSTSVISIRSWVVAFSSQDFEGEISHRWNFSSLTSYLFQCNAVLPVETFFLLFRLFPSLLLCCPSVTLPRKPWHCYLSNYLKGSCRKLLDH